MVKNVHQTGWRISEAIEVHQVRSKVVEIIYLICTEQMKPFKFQFNLFSGQILVWALILYLLLFFTITIIVV